MTISSELRKAGPYAGNGINTVFSFGFALYLPADLYVVKTVAGVETVLVYGTNYSVVLNSNQESNPGGSITLTAALAVGHTLTIGTNLPFTQETQISNLGGFFPEVINRALDRTTILIQQVRENVTRSLRLPFSAPANVSPVLPLPEAGKAIGWNATGTGLANLVATGGSSGGGGGGGTGADGADGEDGLPGLSAFLTNPSIVLASTEAGVVGNYLPSAGAFKVFSGPMDVTDQCVFTVESNPENLTITLGSATGLYEVTAGMDAVEGANVTLRAMWGAVTIDLPFTVAKVRTGVRGSRAFFGVSGSWVDATADATITSLGLTKVLMDQVTLTTPPFSETRYWSGTAWIAIGQVIGGNMLIDGTVLARHLAAGSVTTEKLAVLSANGMRIDMQGGNIVTTDGIVMNVIGSGFGVNAGAAKFLEWYGPYLADVEQCSDANGFMWKKRNGTWKDYAGVHTIAIGASANASGPSTTLEAATGSFASAGGTIQVSLSYSFNVGVATFIAPTSPSLSETAQTASIELYRSINGGGESLVATLTANGAIASETSAPFEIPGMGTFSTLVESSTCTGSLVYTDPATLAQPRTYRAVKVASPHPSDLGRTDEAQTITIVATET